MRHTFTAAGVYLLGPWSRYMSGGLGVCAALAGGGALACGSTDYVRIAATWRVWVGLERKGQRERATRQSSARPRRGERWVLARERQFNA